MIFTSLNETSVSTVRMLVLRFFENLLKAGVNSVKKTVTSAIKFIVTRKITKPRGGFARRFELLKFIRMIYLNTAEIVWPALTCTSRGFSVAPSDQPVNTAPFSATAVNCSSLLLKNLP